MSGIYSSSSTCSSRSGASYTSNYDSWGNVTSRTFNHTTATLSYDSLDHFVEWNAGNTNQQWNVYDGSGNRVLSRSISSSGHSVTVYAFGLEEHTYSFDSGGTLLSQNQVYYYSLGGSLLGALEVGNSSNTNFFLTDALGSVLASINNTANSAAVQGNQLYDPYGNSRYSSGTIGTTKGFTGQYADATGLDYYGSRYYDPAANVFLSADPLQGDLAGANPYEYVGSNPETNTDPSGERFISPSGGQQGPLGPINSDNVPYTPPTYPSPSGLGAGQVGGNIGGNTLNLQPDACTQAPCKVSLATELDQFLPGTARSHVLAGGSSCAGSSSFSLVGIDGTLIAGGGGLSCTSVGGGQFQDNSAGQVVRHTFAFTACVPWYACSDEDNQGDSSGGDEKASGSSMTDLAASDTGGETGDPGATDSNGGGDLPSGWVKEDYGSDNIPGISDFTHTDEAGNKLEVTLYHDSRELQISWMDSLSQARDQLPGLVNWLGDSVETVKGYVTDNLATYFSPPSRGVTLVNRMLSSALEESGFAQGIVEVGSGRTWLIFRR